MYGLLELVPYSVRGVDNDAVSLGRLVVSRMRGRLSCSDTGLVDARMRPVCHGRHLVS